ncbi:peptide-methionine (S)-S-oxide reductase MsrA [Geomonas sp. RF6]|uniref:peptide-methionine (S)-S-oxide reductase MsrA n=1 Tax=Geomonas sp. RF6 TaxID=2897342 RepID=UPI001E547861|nr:peptide-methionine (S)-S-oxide reductase MsrA [Geomonas sp. RF6]UFS68696.1 peptide-methionine (S)-S-oxide reductase MsrA [Geomonas sp. RF6]
MMGELLFDPFVWGAAALLSLDGPHPLETATFAGGCFWSMEPVFDHLPGVVSVTPGYTGGRTEEPTYEEVSSGRSGHVEAVQILYDPKRTSYGKLLEVFWRNIDPTVKNRQFCDVGPQYRSVIFFETEAQRRLAERSREALERAGLFDGRILTEIIPARAFYPAEDYHRQFYRKHPTRYAQYWHGSGREKRLSELWGE